MGRDGDLPGALGQAAGVAQVSQGHVSCLIPVQRLGKGLWRETPAEAPALTLQVGFLGFSLCCIPEGLSGVCWSGCGKEGGALWGAEKAP